jgi:hypothetical protein
MSPRIERYLYSRRNIVGSLLGLCGLGLYFLGVTGGILWLPIVAGLYAIGVLVVPPEPGLDIRVGGVRDAAEVRAGLDRLLRSIRGRVADDLYAQVVGIRESILATLAQDSADGATDRDLFLIRQTALDYLPEALGAYLALPRRYAERRTVEGGRTPHDVLLEQLDMMAGKMAEVADDLARHDTDRLLAHGRFLREKFAVSSLEIGDSAGGSDGQAADSPPVATGARVSDAPADVQSGEVGETAERERVH